jgi:hypothetical protein
MENLNRIKLNISCIKGSSSVGLLRLCGIVMNLEVSAGYMV